jgi:phytoene dehydrogenase-like protein
VKDYDVILIGAGINGLTTAAYLQKAGLSVGVFEARGQCGAHCDTIELGIPGFLHNTHAAWLVPAMSPAMLDLELASYGLDLRGTDVIFAKPFKDGKNSVQALDLEVSLASVARHSDADAATVMAFQEFGAEHMEEAIAVAQLALFAPPTMEVAERTAKLNGEMCKAMGLPIDGDDVARMTGFELLEIAFES